jgi:hypothetical protein
MIVVMQVRSVLREKDVVMRDLCPQTWLCCLDVDNDNATGSSGWYPVIKGTSVAKLAWAVSAARNSTVAVPGIKDKVVTIVGIISGGHKVKRVMLKVVYDVRSVCERRGREAR